MENIASSTVGLISHHCHIFIAAVILDVSETEDMKRRMYSCVMVVGGGLMFPGLHGWLHYLLWTQMPHNLRLTLESLEVVTQTKVK